MIIFADIFPTENIFLAIFLTDRAVKIHVRHILFLSRVRLFPFRRSRLSCHENSKYAGKYSRNVEFNVNYDRDLARSINRQLKLHIIAESFKTKENSSIYVHTYIDR